MDAYPKTQEERDRAEYEIACREGDKRFGSECKHETVKNGHCVKCWRKVIA